MDQAARSVATPTGHLMFLRQGDYDPRDFEELEITALTSTLVWKDGAPSMSIVVRNHARPNRFCRTRAPDTR